MFPSRNILLEKSKFDENVPPRELPAARVDPDREGPGEHCSDALVHRVRALRKSGASLRPSCERPASGLRAVPTLIEKRAGTNHAEAARPSHCGPHWSMRSRRCGGSSSPPVSARSSERLDLATEAAAIMGSDVGAAVRRMWRP